MKLRNLTRRGTLFIVAMLFATSGALRLGSGVGSALARAEDMPAGGEALACETPADLPAALAEALGQREARVVAQEASLQDRLAALALADAAINTRLTELAAMEEELRATLAMADSAAEEDIAQLTAVYQAMKPKDAAALFQTMAPEFAAGFLGRMPPEAAAAILSGMSAEAAYGISVIVAGQNASAPKN